jgi:ubiquinone/menaquinone biosynthesis C-methylase UbiE
MVSIDKNVELSYQMQRENFFRKDEEARRIQETWFREDTVDFWRHHRSYAPIAPLLSFYKGSRWLTVGDGRYGLDSIRLKKIQGDIEVLPTDIAPELLQKAKDINLIGDFSAENAESLSFENDSFDFAFCKEAYHHFPRPYVALYEMLRVSRQGVVLVEPNEKKDHPLPERFVRKTKQLVKKLLGKQIPHPETWSFEVSGNYIYSVSQNEIEKVALGMRIPTVAFYYYNDYYEEGVEFEKAEPDNAVFRRVKKRIAIADLKSKMGLKTYSSIIAILFKNPPAAELRKEIERTGFQIIDLPENPYLKKRNEEI